MSPDHVVDGDVVVVDRPVEAIPQAEIEADVEGLFLLPGQAGVYVVAETQRDVGRNDVGPAVSISVGSVIPGLVARVAVHAALVTHYAVVGAQFQVGQPGRIGQPGFARKTPCAAYGPEGAPAGVVVPEFRRTVSANRCRYVVFVIVVVVRPHEVAFESFLIDPAADTAEGGAAVQRKEVRKCLKVGNDRTLRLVVQAVTAVPVELVADQSVHVVLAVIVGPVQGLLRVDVVVFIVILAPCAAGRYGTAGYGVPVTAAHRKGLVGRKVGLECEVFEELGFHITADVDVVRDRLVLVVVQDVIQVCGRGGTAGRTDYRSVLFRCRGVLFVACGIQDVRTISIALEERNQGALTVHPPEYVGDGAARVTAVARCRGLYGPAAVSHVDTGFQPFGDLRVDVAADVVAVELRSLNVRGVFQVTGRDEVVGLVGGAADRNVVLLAETVLQEMAVPGIPVKQFSVRIEFARHRIDQVSTGHRRTGRRTAAGRDVFCPRNVVEHIIAQRVLCKP